MATQVEHHIPMGSHPHSTSCSPQVSMQPPPVPIGTPNMNQDVKTEEVSPSNASSNGQAGTPASSSAASRRPPRKSTLTQQQKNQKRQRATQDQLTTLEMEFNKNPTPTAAVRDRIAEDINMTERSVQIWFQNRRAKIKMLAKKSLETGEDIDSIPESMRAYLAMQAMETGKGLGGGYLGRTGLLPFGHNGMLMPGDPNGQHKVLIHHLTCRSLSIGKWTRVGQNTMDLIIFYSPDKCTMTYYINNEQAGYKIEYPFSHIKNIFLDNNETDPAKIGGIVIELNRPPNFFMDSTTTTNGFYQCADFTEDLQASHCLVHHLGGNPKVLSGQLAKLVSLESFMNRHNPVPYADPHAISMSAPVSPTARPASQPSFPQQNVPMYPEAWSMNNMHSATMRPQGHKRQRSRSVPGPVDFAMFQNQPMPAFYIQPPGDMGPPPPQQNPNIYAPVPQQPATGAHLRIDTQAGFGLDMRQYPMSATTASPSEFPNSPGFFAQEHETPVLPGSSYNTPYSNGGFLSPMPNTEAPVAHPVPSMPFHVQNEPGIVDQSPPGLTVGRSGSAELYGGNDGSGAVSEDGNINDMYSKHAMSVPMHHPGTNFPPSQQGSSLQAELDMDSLLQFDSVDPSSLSPETMPPNNQ